MAQLKLWMFLIKNILFPSFCCLGGIVIVIQQECNLKSRSFYFALRAIILFFFCTTESSKDSILKDGYTNSIKTNTISSVFICNTSRCEFDIHCWILNTGQISSPVF
jgi:hypothetical protein